MKSTSQVLDKTHFFYKKHKWLILFVTALGLYTFAKCVFAQVTGGIFSSEVETIESEAKGDFRQILSVVAFLISGFMVVVKQSLMYVAIFFGVMLFLYLGPTLISSIF